MTGHKLIVSSPKMGGFQLGLKFVSVSLPIAKTGQGMLWDKRTTDQSQTNITNTLKCVRRDPLETKGFKNLHRYKTVFLLHIFIVLKVMMDNKDKHYYCRYLCKVSSMRMDPTGMLRKIGAKTSAWRRSPENRSAKTENALRRA